MKTTATQNKTSTSSSSQPFFNKGGEGTFFANKKEVTTPFFQAKAIQRSLAVGSPNDPFEQEADKVGRQVMDNFGAASSIQAKLSNLGIQTSMIQPMTIGTRISRMVQRRHNMIQQKCAGCEEEDMMAQPKTMGIQFSGDGAMVSQDIENRIQSQRGSGQSMGNQTKTAMESSFGADFSSVNIHTGTPAVQMSQELNAHAFTVGNDIFFNKGRYQPQTKEGAGLLAHELTHTVQQGAAVQNKRISKRPLSQMLSKHAMGHLSTMNENTLSRKEMTQLQNLPEEELMQQKEIFESNEVDKIQKKDSGLSLRRCPQNTNRKAKLKSGPTYTPNGTLKATLNPDGRKYSPSFTRAAEFEHDPSKGIYAACGIIKQSMKWSSDADRPNHAGWRPASNFSANTWYEDRNASGLRASPRSGPTSFCAAGATNGIYKDTSGNRDCANGPVFEGHDRPMDGSGRKTGMWYFKLEAIDTCDNNKVLGTDHVNVDW